MTADPFKAARLDEIAELVADMIYTDLLSNSADFNSLRALPHGEDTEEIA